MIFIATGHYPESPGDGNNKPLGLIEHFEVKKIVRETCNYLKLLDISFKKVPIGNLQSKVNFINTNSSKGDICIEIHLNKFDSNANYMAGLYYSNYGKKISLYIGKSLLNFLPFEKYISFKPNRSLYFLKRTSIPAVIIEPLFCDNIIMANYLLNKRSHIIIGKALAIGLKKGL